MNILITGFSGFLGRNLLKYFKKKKFKLYGLGRSRKKFHNKNFLIGNVNKKNLNSFNKNFQFIIHCAGSGKINYQAKKDYINNVRSTKNILDFLKTSPQTKLIFISSISVFGNHSKKIGNSNRKKPVSTYAKNKLKAEKLCESYSNKYKLDVIFFK